MHLKKAVVAGFVTTVLFSTGFMVYLNSTTITLRKYSLEGLILDDGRNSLHITASLPSETAAPILVNTMHQIEIVSKSSPHPHKQQHLTNYPVEMTREGVNRNMGVVIQDTTTASERLKHGEVVEPITSSAYHRNSSSTPHLDKMEQLNMPIEKNVHPLLNKMSSRRNKFPRNAEKANMSHLLRRKLGHSIMVHQKKMRELIRNRQRYSDVLAMARASCTYDTCLILKDPFPKDAQDDNYCQQAMCLYKTTSYFKKVLTVTDKTMKKCACHLQDDVTKSKSVGLVSMPGSGNTWVRSLLERATHICTGSLWCDPILRSNSFCGEGLRSKKTLVVKNHDSTIRWRGQTLPINSRHKAFSDYNKPLFDAVIFVHRNPFDSLVAEHNRAIANSLREKDIERNKYTTLPPNDHTSFFGEEYFRNNSLWNETVYKLTDSWGEMVQHLLVNSKNSSVLLVHYEDLRSNLFHEMKRMLQFLDYSVTENTLRERLDEKFTTFYRNHTSEFEHFTSEQKKYVNSILASKVETGLPLKQYIRP